MANRKEKTVEIMTYFISLGSKTLQTVIAAMKLRHLVLGRKDMTNLDSVLKSRDITLPTKVIWSKLWFYQWSCTDVRVGP